MSKNKSIILFVLLITTLILAFISAKSSFENVGFLRTKNDKIDESLYIEIYDSNDINFIKAKSKEIIELKTKYRHKTTDIFANQFEFLLLQIVIIIISISIILFEIFKKSKTK